MDDLDYLADDHTLLSSQVIHVLALLRAIDEGRFGLAELYAEVLRQAEILRAQIAEHFAFEETTSFPHLKEKYPEFRGRLQAMQAQHADVLDAFEAFQSALNSESPVKLAEALTKGVLFETSFESHATQETQLLLEISALKVAQSGAL